MPSYAGVIGRARRRPANRRTSLVNKPQPTTPILVDIVQFVGSTAIVHYDQPVSLKGVPAYTTSVVGATAVSAVLSSPTSVTITFSAPVAAATSLSVPPFDPGVRNASGGFVVTDQIVPTP